MDMMKMMKQAADLQKNLKKKQKDLAKTNIQYELNGVKIEMSCEMKIKSIEISDEILESNDLRDLYVPLPIVLSELFTINLIPLKVLHISNVFLGNELYKILLPI